MGFSWWPNVLCKFSHKLLTNKSIHIQLDKWGPMLGYVHHSILTPCESPSRKKLLFLNKLLPVFGSMRIVSKWGFEWKFSFSLAKNCIQCLVSVYFWNIVASIQTQQHHLFLTVCTQVCEDDWFRIMVAIDSG